MEGMKWQGAESLTRKYQPVLAYNHDWGCDVAWIDSNGLWWSSGGQIRNKPTHWQPLPESPEPPQ